jgi:hypothetical protein
MLFKNSVVLAIDACVSTFYYSSMYNFYGKLKKPDKRDLHVHDEHW